MNFVRKLSSAVMVLAGLLLLGLCITTVFDPTDAEAQIRRSNPVPQFWMDSTSSNGFGLNTAGVPYVMLSGTNYTGVSTNVSFLIGTGVTNRLRIVNGVVTGVIAGP